VKSYLFKYRWYLAGAVFMGFAAACYEQHGKVEEMASHVWEEADRLTRMTTPNDDAK
jgi:hypothetical protein